MLCSSLCNFRVRVKDFYGAYFLLNVALLSMQTGLNFWRLQTTMKQNSLLKHKTRYHSFQMPDSFDAPESHVIIQPLDHFDPQIKVSCFEDSYSTVVLNTYVTTVYFFKPMSLVMVMNLRPGL